MKSTLILACFLLSSVLPCFSQSRGETRIIGNLNTGEPVATAPPAKALPDFQVQDSRTHRVGERNVTVQKVAPPKSVAVKTKEQAVQSRNRLDLNSSIPSAGLVFLTALPAKGGGYDLEIGLNGEWLKAWTNMEVHYLNGLNDFIANGRRYNMIALPVAGKALSEDKQGRDKNKSRRARRDKREPAPRYFLTGYEGNEQVCRTLLKDLHDLYHVEKRSLRWAYRERLKNQVTREAKLKANPPKKEDVTIRYWELSAEEIKKLKKRKTK